MKRAERRRSPRSWMRLDNREEGKQEEEGEEEERQEERPAARRSHVGSVEAHTSKESAQKAQCQEAFGLTSKQATTTAMAKLEAKVVARRGRRMDRGRAEEKVEREKGSSNSSGQWMSKHKVNGPNLRGWISTRMKRPETKNGDGQSSWPFHSLRRVRRLKNATNPLGALVGLWEDRVR